MERDADNCRRLRLWQFQRPSSQRSGRNEMTKKLMPIMMLMFLSGCNEPKQVSGTDFKREYELRNNQTMVSSEYLGEKDGKVFLRRKTMSLVNKDKWNEEIWFTGTNNLDAAFLAALRKEIVNQASEAIGAGAPQPQR